MKFRSSLFTILAVALCALVISISAPSAFAFQYMIDLEANGKLPGQAGGKSADVTANGQAVSVDVYLLVQGNDANANNDTLKNLAGYLFSSNDAGSMFGNISSVAIRTSGPVPVSGPNDGFSGIGAMSGAPTDADGDGDLDLGKNGLSIGHFQGMVNPITNYGFGVGKGFSDGTVNKNSLVYAPPYTAGSFTNGLTDLVAYAQVGTFTYTVTDGGLYVGKFTDIQSQPRSNSTNTTTLQTNAIQGAIDDTGSGGTNANASGLVSTILLGQAVRVTMVPEPSTMILSGLGLLGLVAFALGRRRA